MLQILHDHTSFSKIEVPEYYLIKENSVIELDIQRIRIEFNSMPGTRLQLTIRAICIINEFLCEEEFIVGTAERYLDIVINRDLYVMDIYTLAVPVVDALRAHIKAQNISYYKNDDFPLEPPEVTKTEMLSPVLKIRESRKLNSHELN